MIKESKMKKILVLLVAAMVSLGLAQDLGGKVFKVGSDTTYPPFEFIDDASGDIVGFDVDLANAVCAKINCTLEFTTTAWDGLFAALDAGEFDMAISGISITAERDETFDFSDAYFFVNPALAVRSEDEALTLDDFSNNADLMVGAQTGTTNADVITELFGRDRVRLYDTFGAAAQALVNGDIDGMCIDGPSADAFVQEYAGQLVVNIAKIGEGTPLGFMFRDGDENVDAFNAGLKMIQEDGTLDELVAKWNIPAE
jgi:polar amino acid transport system substrate-binding protein